MDNKAVNIFYCELNLLSQDNTSGSKELLKKLNKLIIDNISYIEFDDSFFKNLLSTFQSFEAIHKYLSELKTISSTGGKAEIHSFLKSYEKKNEEIYQKIYYNLKSRLKDPVSIITISNSKTIYEVIKRLKEKSLIKNVVVCESRPQKEGRILADKLLNIDIDVQLVLEAQIPSFIDKIDIGIIGSDKVLSNGNVINKIGSNLIALCCSHFHIPLYVLSDSSKFSNELNFSQIAHSRKEVWKDAPENMKISNYYFEEVDSNLLTEIITED